MTRPGFEPRTFPLSRWDALTTELSGLVLNYNAHAIVTLHTSFQKFYYVSCIDDNGHLLLPSIYSIPLIVSYFPIVLPYMDILLFSPVYR